MRLEAQHVAWLQVTSAARQALYLLAYDWEPPGVAAPPDREALRHAGAALQALAGKVDPDPSAAVGMALERVALEGVTVEGWSRGQRKRVHSLAVAAHEQIEELLTALEAHSE